jgi:hypothetical protein
LVFVGAFIYDVLCGLFYLAALTYYVHIREKGAYLRPLQLVLFLVLYICALNSKEMAVSLPVIVLIYELLKSSRWASWNALLSWTRLDAAPALIGGAITAVFVYSKIGGTASTTISESYRPIYSWHNFVTSNARFVGELLYAPETITPTALLLWAGVFIYAFCRRNHAGSWPLGGDRSPADSISSSDPQWRMSLSPAFRLGTIFARVQVI